MVFNEIQKAPPSEKNGAGQEAEDEDIKRKQLSDLVCAALEDALRKGRGFLSRRCEGTDASQRGLSCSCRRRMSISM